MFRWLKKYMPRSLYGRAALILLVPVVSVQLVVSVVFIQRHFNSITDQMTGVVAQELAYLVQQVNAAPDQAAARQVAQTLGPAMLARVSLPAPGPVADRRRWDDFTGARVVRVLRAGVPGLVGADLSGPVVRLGVDTRFGLMEVAFPRQRLSARNPHQLLVLMVFFGVLMTLIAYIFLRNQLRPIKRLARAAEAFGRGEVLPYHLAGATEVRAAGQAFLDMRARIERQNEARRLMLSGVGHDLRTPLTRLKLGLGMLPEGADTAALLRDVEDMERLVEAFLTFARADHDGASLLAERAPADPALLAREAAERARRAGHAVELGRLAAPGPVALAVQPLGRALDNLLSNAARHARQHTRLSLEHGGGTIRFVVEDDGPGIAPEDRAQALKPFARLDSARNQDRGAGLGLGLAIAADIARAAGGRLVLGRSADLGGLRAEIVLPL